MDKRKEYELIEKQIKDKDYVVTLEIEGKSMDSKSFSNFIEKSLISHSNIVFIIGGSNGLDEKIDSHKNMSISFSKMTFPHHLFRVILLEQIYRAYKISNHENYHK